MNKKRIESLIISPAQQLDIMEHPAIKDVIVLQTVREEIRHLSTPVYNRLNAILADKTKRFYMFANEHQRLVNQNYELERLFLTNAIVL